MKRIVHIIEYILLRLTSALLDRLSLRATVRVVTGIAGSWYTLGFRRRPVTRSNLLLSGVARNADEADRLGRESYRHFGIVIAESLKSDSLLPAIGSKALSTRIDPQAEQVLKDPDAGVILATAHFGSWELGAQALSLMKPVAGVTERMSNPYSDRYLKARKARHGFYLLPKHDQSDPTRFIDVLKKGHALALMIDLYALAGRGIDVDFFGRPAATYTTPAILHLITGAPLCFGYCLRTSEGNHELHLKGPFKFSPTGNRKADTRTIMEKLTRELETAIRAHPGQYLWAYRRWR